MILQRRDVPAVRPIGKVKNGNSNCRKRFPFFDFLELPIRFRLPFNLVRDLSYKLNITLCQHNSLQESSAGFSMLSGGRASMAPAETGDRSLHLELALIVSWHITVS